jgi:hypothetical protein
VDFGASWPAAHAQLSAVLRSRGVQATDVDDVAQEVALRALSDCRDFESDDHFVAWCCRVAVNLHIDSTRRQRRLSPEPPADTDDGQDTAATAQRRMALGVLADRIGELSDDDRRLLFDLEPTGSRRDAVRLAVRRHRLRARLAALVEGMVAGLAWVRRLRFPREVSTPVKLSLAVAPLVAAGLMLGPFATNGASPSAPGTVPSTQPRVLTRATLPGVAPTGVGAPRTTVVTATPRPAGRAAASTVGAASSKVIVGAKPAGVPVQVSKDEHPPSGQLICTGGVVNQCVPKPPPGQVPGGALTPSGA